MKRANTMSTITVELIIKMKTKFTSSNAKKKTNGFISPQMSHNFHTGGIIHAGTKTVIKLNVPDDKLATMINSSQPQANVFFQPDNLGALLHLWLPCHLFNVHAGKVCPPLHVDCG